MPRLTLIITLSLRLRRLEHARRGDILQIAYAGLR